LRDLDPGSPLPRLSCRHPSIRTLCERLMRSVHTGCSRYSRRCHLLGRPLVSSVDGTGARPRAQSPELDVSFVVHLSPFLNYAAANRRLRLLCSGSYASQLIHRWCSKVASLRATATMARFLPFLPPRSASFSPHRHRSESSPNGPRMCCAPCTKTIRR
jgi:hypothetical protein